MVHCSHIWRGYFIIFYSSGAHTNTAIEIHYLRMVVEKSLWNQIHWQVRCLDNSIEHGSVPILLIFIHLWSNLRETKVSHPTFRTSTSRGNEDMIGLMTCNTSILCDVLFHFSYYFFFFLFFTTWWTFCASHLKCEHIIWRIRQQTLIQTHTQHTQREDESIQTHFEYRTNSNTKTMKWWNHVRIWACPKEYYMFDDHSK